MTNRINLHLKRTLDQYSDFSFSTEHDTDLVGRWLKDTPEQLDRILDGSHDWEESSYEYPYDYEMFDFDFNNNVGEEEEDNYDEHPDYDNDIKKWKIEQTIDMNLIFSSECEVQKITDFIKENEKIFIFITKKKWEWELTDVEKKVFFDLKKIVGLPVPNSYSRTSK